MNAFKLLSVSEAIAAARGFKAALDAAEQPHRATTGLSLNAIASLAVLALQFDRLAQTAAAFSQAPEDFDLWQELQEQLLTTGYLPLRPANPSSQAAQEPDDGPQTQG